jgi:helix-turn-helix protein
METVGPYDDCMSFREAAKYLGYAPTTVKAFYEAMDLPVTRIAGRVWFRKSELDAWQVNRMRAASEHERRRAIAFAKAEGYTRAEERA